MLLVEQELLPFRSTWVHPPVFSGVRGTRSLVFMCMFCRSLFVLLYFFFFAIVVSVLLRSTNSDYPFGIFKLLLPYLTIWVARGYLIRSRKSLPFARIWIHLRFSVGFVVLIVFCVVYFLFCVFDMCIVTNVALVSTLFNLDCLFGFL
jgi:hypothetical protein